MKRELVGRFVAAMLIGMSFGFYVHHDYLKWSQRGRDAFLAYQAHRFDRFMLSPHPTIVTVFAFTLVLGLSLGVYELLAAGLVKMLSIDAANRGKRV